MNSMYCQQSVTKAMLKGQYTHNIIIAWPPITESLMHIFLTTKFRHITVAVLNYCKKQVALL